MLRYIKTECLHVDAHEESAIARQERLYVDYDVVVVGAGPAGCVAARYAAMKGARCVIIDRKRNIGTPVRCAEVVAGTLPSSFGMNRDI